MRKKENREKPREHSQRKEQPKRKHMKRGIERASSSQYTIVFGFVSSYTR
jgi:hypothetical protein